MVHETNAEKNRAAELASGKGQVIRQSSLAQTNAFYKSDGYTKIYVGSVCSTLDEANLKHVFDIFGAIESVNLARDPDTGRHKGYAFIQYRMLRR